MTQVKQPLSIIHVNSKATDNRPWLVNECIKAFHMKDAEAELLRFYALKCSNGFKPAVLYIERQTGLPRSSIFNARCLLLGDGLINVTDKTLSVDWDRIRLFASLKNETGSGNTPAIAKQRRHRYIAPAQNSQWSHNNYVSNLLNNPVGSEQREEGLDIYMYLRLKPEELSAWLSTLSEKEYREFRRSVKKYQKYLDRAEKKLDYTIYTENNDKVIQPTDAVRDNDHDLNNTEKKRDYTIYTENAEKKLDYTIYTEKTNSPLSDLPLGPFSVQDAESYKVISRDKINGTRLVCPELFEEIVPDNKDEQHYMGTGMVEEYRLPF